MMDCKKALVESDGNLEAAVEYLQVKGITKAGKKADRVAAEGLVSTVVSSDGVRALMVEVNCETDFVSRNEQFQALVETIARTLASSDVTTVEEAQSLEVDGHSLEEVVK